LTEVSDAKKERRKASEIKPHALHNIDDNKDGSNPRGDKSKPSSQGNMDFEN